MTPRSMASMLVATLLLVLLPLSCTAWAPIPSPAVTTGGSYVPTQQLHGREIRHHSLGVKHDPSLLFLQRHKRASSASASALQVSLTGTEIEKQQQQQQQQEPQVPDQKSEDGEEVTPQQKVINAVFLAASFGYALYAILSIDEGMTRGWSASEIAMRIPLDNWGNYESCLANQPISTKTTINVIIYLLGDWLSQTAFAGKDLLNFDLSRTLRNGFIGLCFGPLVHEYYQFSDTILPPEDGLVTRLEKILMDQTIYLTIKCSMYISAVGLLSGDDWPTVKQNVQDKIGGIVITAWKFWPLVHCITYGLVPARHRILWVNSVDLIWNAILASKTQGTEEETTEVPEEANMLAATDAQIMAQPSLHDIQVKQQTEDEITIMASEDEASLMGGRANMTAAVAA